MNLQVRHRMQLNKIVCIRVHVGFSRWFFLKYIFPLVFVSVRIFPDELIIFPISKGRIQKYCSFSIKDLFANNTQE